MVTNTPSEDYIGMYRCYDLTCEVVEASSGTCNEDTMSTGWFSESGIKAAKTIIDDLLSGVLGSS